MDFYDARDTHSRAILIEKSLQNGKFLAVPKTPYRTGCTITSGIRHACRVTSAGHARPFMSFPRHTRTSFKNRPEHVTDTASGRRPGFAATNSSRIFAGATVRAVFGDCIAAGAFTPANAARAFPK